MNTAKNKARGTIDCLDDLLLFCGKIYPELGIAKRFAELKVLVPPTTLKYLKSLKVKLP